MVSYTNKVLKNGQPIPGVLVRLYNEENVLCGSVSTNWRGRYTFYNITPGNYQIRFFGENFTEDAWFNITITGTGVEAVPIVFAGGNPSLGVSEIAGEWKLTGGPLTKASFSFTNLTTSAGVIKNILIEVKLSSEAASGWKTYKNYNFDPSLASVASDSSTATFTQDIGLDEIPSVYDFRASFFNAGGVPALSSGNVIYASDSSITFNGISDVAEYIGVDEVEVKNERVIASGISQLPTNELMLEWTDPRTDGPSTVYYDAAGNLTSVTADQKNNLDGYGVFMFVSTYGQPPSAGNYPGSTGETNGNWYFLTSVSKDLNYTSVRVPEKKDIMLWVGFKGPRTISILDDLEPFVFKR